jgi:hypothetical protein
LETLGLIPQVVEEGDDLSVRSVGAQQPPGDRNELYGNAE